MSQSVTAGGQVGQDSAPISIGVATCAEQGAVSARMVMQACVFQKTWAANARLVGGRRFTGVGALSHGPSILRDGQTAGGPWRVRPD